jgi:hypothetical protein
MAKQNLPQIGDPAPKRPSTVKQEPQTVSVTEQPEDIGFVPRRLDVRLSRKHAIVLKQKQRQLEDAGAKLDDGTEVSDRTKTLIWILENEVK